MEPEQRIGCGGWLLYGILALGCAGLCSGVLSSPDHSPDNGPPEPDIADGGLAHLMAKQFLLDQLKAPSTAKFPRASQASISQLDDNRWVVESYVDSQNSFGAMIRSKWTAIVKYKGNRNWNLEAIDIAP